MRYSIEFGHPDTGEKKIIEVEIEDRERGAIEDARKFPDQVPDADLIGMAYALRLGYRQAPAGFLHLNPPARVSTH